MIGFDVSAVTSIFFTIAVYIGIGTPPVLIQQAKQFMIYPHGPHSPDAITLGGLINNDFSLSLEWTLFNPNGGFCPADLEIPSPSEFVTDTQSEIDYELSNFDQDQASSQHVVSSLLDNTEVITPQLVYINSSSPFTQTEIRDDIKSVSELDCTISVSPIDRVTSYHLEVSTLDLYRITPSSLSTDATDFLSEYQPLPGSDSGVLWYHEQLRLYLRNVILSSLPETWANWITSNRLTLGIVCVTVMYASLLWPLLFVLWRQVNAKRRMIGELKWVYAENRNLKGKISSLEKESKTSSDHLRNVQMKMEGITEHVHSIEESLQAKLIVAKKKLEQYELLEFEAQEKLILVEEKLEKERNEFLDSKRRLRAYIKTLQDDVQMNRNRADKAVTWIQYSEQQLRLANRTIAELILKRRSNVECELSRCEQECLTKTKSCTLLLEGENVTFDETKIQTVSEISSTLSSTPAEDATHEKEKPKLVSEHDTKVDLHEVITRKDFVSGVDLKRLDDVTEKTQC